MPGGRKLRSTRKGSKDKDYAKIHEGSPLPDDDEQMSSLTLATSAKKLNKKQKKVAAKKQHCYIYRRDMTSHRTSIYSDPDP